jgi:Fic family protein
LREVYRRRVQSERAVARLLQLLDLLFANPVASIPGLAKSMDVSFVAATRYVRHLTEIGVLREATGRTRNRIFVAEEILRAVQDPLPASE